MPPEQDGCHIRQQLPDRIAGRQVSHLVRQHGLLPGVKVIRKACRKNDDRPQDSKRNRGCQPGRRQDFDPPSKVQADSKPVYVLPNGRLTDAKLLSAKTPQQPARPCHPDQQDSRDEEPSEREPDAPSRAVRYSLSNGVRGRWGDLHCESQFSRPASARRRSIGLANACHARRRSPDLAEIAERISPAFLKPIGWFKRGSGRLMHSQRQFAGFGNVDRTGRHFW